MLNIIDVLWKDFGYRAHFLITGTTIVFKIEMVRPAIFFKNPTIQIILIFFYENHLHQVNKHTDTTFIMVISKKEKRLLRHF